MRGFNNDVDGESKVRSVGWAALLPTRRGLVLALAFVVVTVIMFVISRGDRQHTEVGMESSSGGTRNSHTRTPMCA
jgi:hypothetical protein